MTADFGVGYANVMTPNGIEPQLVDLAVTRAPTKQKEPPRHVLEEMRVAAERRER